MKTARVNIHAVRSINFRTDASYHLSEGQNVQRCIAASPYPLTTIKEVSEDIFIGNRAKRVYVKDSNHGIPFLSSSDILKADLDNVKLASKKYTPEIERMSLKKGWTLISRSGTIGNCAFANAKHAQKLASEDVIRLVPNNILRGGLVYAYLASKYGHSLLTQGTFGAVIQHIEPAFVGSIAIPLFPDSFQQEVDNLVQEAARLREEASDALEYAIGFFNTLFPVPFKDNCLGKVSSKEIMTSINKRFEASFHISEGKDIDKYIKEHYEWKSLGEVCSNISRPDIFKRYYVKNGITFLGGADIFLATPDSEKRLSKTKTGNISQLAIKEGTILLPRSGTIGNVAWAHAGHAQKLASEHVIRLLPNDMLRAGYVYAFLASKYGKLLIQRYIFGSVIQHVEPPHLKLIPVPFIDQKTMDDIHDKIMIYSSAMGKAIEFEQKAIHMVEQEIEKWNKH